MDCGLSAFFILLNYKNKLKQFTHNYRDLMGKAAAFLPYVMTPLPRDNVGASTQNFSLYTQTHSNTPKQHTTRHRFHSAPSRFPKQPTSCTQLSGGVTSKTSIFMSHLKKLGARGGTQAAMVELYPPPRTPSSPTPRTCNVTLFESRRVVDVMS